MKRIWLFYPENDIALSHGASNFTAPPAAVQLRRSGAMLPLWLADEGDSVLCDGVNAQWFDTVTAQFGLRADVWQPSCQGVPTPWGWSWGARRLFVNAGFSADTLPSAEALEAIRQLAHRRTAIRVAHMVTEQTGIELACGAFEATTIEQVEQAAARWSDFVIKTPWSSSGRGVYFATSDHPGPALQPASGSIRRHGSVIVEEYMPDAHDFAMLYNCSDNAPAQFVGYSCFKTQGGRYVGNYVEPQSGIRARIEQLVDAAVLQQLQDAVAVALGDVCRGVYNGVAGVDFLIDGKGRVHLSEINFRYTMGFVAAALAPRVANSALFHIEKAGEAVVDPVVENGQLIKGTLALTPPGGDFDFLLTIQ